MGTFIIVRYLCEIDGERTDGVDYKVRYFDTSSEQEAVARIHSESPEEYKNSDNENVRWIFDEIMSVEVNPSFEDGDEIIGFTTGESKRNKDTKQTNATDA